MQAQGDVSDSPWGVRGGEWFTTAWIAPWEESLGKKEVATCKVQHVMFCVRGWPACK
ncbi:hypothetical protein DSLASN_21740 [Desulfoluna limicola]|uniref:Uncharacterized protein n=1 Tax=Desulfoluna limicola TaxID=2810562 RepID=A0ABM7PG12_9BACT|nr:hypothetical protein DSLASN_21740 [Desulfoluna limicola]